MSQQIIVLSLLDENKNFFTGSQAKLLIEPVKELKNLQNKIIDSFKFKLNLHGH
jgi:hypothetical protein